MGKDWDLGKHQPALVRLGVHLRYDAGATVRNRGFAPPGPGERQHTVGTETWQEDGSASKLLLSG